VGNEGRWVFAVGGVGRADKLHCVGSGARRDWCVTERGCQLENVVSGGTRASPMRNGSGGFHAWRCGQSDFDFGLLDGLFHLWRCEAHPWSVVRLLWLWSRRNRGPVDGGGGKLLERSACWPMSGGLEDWRSDSGDRAWFLPSTEEVAESGYCMELGVACGRGSIDDGIGDGIKAVDNGVGWCDSGDGEVVMKEVDSVRDAEGLGFGIDDAMAVVMLKRDADVESIRAVEVPGAASGWLIVGDDGAAKWEERGGIVVEGAIQVFPGGHAWRGGGSVEEVDC
jgi:hypothetical protein